MSGCQKRKLTFLRLLRLSSVNWGFGRKLEFNNNINHNINNKYNNKGIRKLNIIEDIQTLKLFEEINLEKK